MSFLRFAGLFILYDGSDIIQVSSVATKRYISGKTGLILHGRVESEPKISYNTIDFE